MTWVDNQCPNDGQYAILSHTSGCFGYTWLDIQQDHTGNQAGYFMCINASYQPSDFYVQTVNGLCGGTSYQFAAWILNLAAHPGQILPNVTFHIEKTDGTELATYGTGDIKQSNTPVWNQYAFYFNTPPGISTVVLRMTNNAPGGIGNDLCLDDITFRTAGSSVQLNAAGFPSDSITVCDYAQQVMNFNALVESCYPSQQEQWQESTDSGASWSDISGATTNTYTRSTTAPGVYLYRLLAAQTGNIGISTCEVASKPIMVDVIRKPSPVVSITASLPTICQNLPITFTAAPIDGGGQPVYQWLVNGQPAGTDSTGFTTVALQNGDAVKCVMTSDAACVLNPMAVSNTLALPVVAVPVQGVSIQASATSICQDSLVQFVAVPSNGGSAPALQWQVNGVDTGSGGPVFSSAGLKNGDVVNCIMTGSLTCSQPVNADQPVAMTVYPLPEVRLDSAVVIGGGTRVRLTPVVSADVVRWDWNPAMGLDDALAADPWASPVSTTLYQVTVTTAEGCHASAAEWVEVYYPLQMPGAFTPNGDGRNDVFRVPPAFPVTILSFSVYNRQGAQVFYTTNVAEGWDGRFNGAVQPSGVYVWELVFVNPLTKKVEGRKGTVVLVR
ncbi:hypothetical protein GCM10011511_46660 [Puia dinghuensis]|uniref:Gliding motility-associated C-terminal domain-containing protein n=2 Tax=Puia dinghuensis TaxID=1792502 RepID=A0A8J2UHN1_9BACT|nr:hypothetical protein GCM10011511_46660 [Puia dinghuensis]